MQKNRNLFNQDFKAEPAWSIRPGHRTLGSGAFPDFRSWRALANSMGEKSPEIHSLGGVWILQSWDTSLITNLADSRFVVLYILKTNCEAIEFAVIGERRRMSLVLPVKLLIIFYDSRLGWVKSMLLTASNLFVFCRGRTARRKQLNYSLHPVEPVEKANRGVCTLHPNKVNSYFCDHMELTILLPQRWYYRSRGMPHQ